MSSRISLSESHSMTFSRVRFWCGQLQPVLLFGSNLYELLPIEMPGSRRWEWPGLLLPMLVPQHPMPFELPKSMRTTAK